MCIYRLIAEGCVCIKIIIYVLPLQIDPGTGLGSVASIRSMNSFSFSSHSKAGQTNRL